ncbi:MAG: Cys-tRNA(Pro) deacylase [Raoultibacter sp.]
MAKQDDRKTNAMRELERAKIPYSARWFPCPEALSGTEVARLLELDEMQVFKTLVTVGKSGKHYVFMVPVSEELDLKKAANAVEEKSIQMIKSKELLDLTGYIHGGCSPLGMKHRFTTTIDETAILFDTVVFSGGRLGCQIEASLNDLQRILSIGISDLIA